MRLLILGAGPLGRQVGQAAQAAGGYEEILYMDNELTGPDIQSQCGGFPVYADGLTEMIPAMEQDADQQEWLERLEDMLVPLATVVHPQAVVEPSAVLSPGTAVLSGAHVFDGVTLATGCILCEGVSLTADRAQEKAAIIRV